MICKGCGQPIVGRYVIALGATWHPEHLLCSVCGHPILSQYYEYEGKIYHPDCYITQIAPRCVYCNKPLISEYKIDFWGNKFCAQHKFEYQACRYCGRLVPPHQLGAKFFPDGKVSCSICQSEAIKRTEQANLLLEQIGHWFNKQGLWFKGLKLRIELYDYPEITQTSSDLVGKLGTTHFMFYSESNRIIRMDVKKVSILRGLPIVLFQGVAAHELGHVWLIVHQIHIRESWKEEGFCEILAHRYYKSLNTRKGTFYANLIEQQRDPVYGMGFQYIYKIVRNMGFYRLINYIKVNKNIP